MGALERHRAAAAAGGEVWKESSWEVVLVAAVVVAVAVAVTIIVDPMHSEWNRRRWPGAEEVVVILRSGTWRKGKEIHFYINVDRGRGAGGLDLKSRIQC